MDSSCALETDEMLLQSGHSNKAHVLEFLERRASQLWVFLPELIFGFQKLSYSETIISLARKMMVGILVYAIFPAL